jgi:MFS family permease
VLKAGPSPRLLIASLSIVALTVAVLQTAVVPVLGLIADQLQASTIAVSWTVTANLLAAAAATPLLSRLADLYNKKYVLLGVLAVVLIGSVLAATTDSLPVLIAARALQGVSYSLYPICVAVLRDELIEAQVVRALAVLSAILGFGGGMGLVATGLLVAGDADYHRVFWLTTVFSLVVILIVIFVIPSRRRRGEGSIDWLGAVGLAAGLSAVLLAITQGNSWGWASVATIAAAATGVLVLVLWAFWERSRRYPLVSISLLTRRAMLLTNLATVFVGMGLYFSFLGLTAFVQVPREAAGYGFSASVLHASLVYLLPGAVAGLVIAVVTGIVGFVWLAVAHSQPWQVIAAGIFANAYVSLAYGALPALVVSEADRGETGIATGLNAIARTVGSAVAAAVVAVLLGHTLAGTGQPAESAYVIIFVAGAVTAALATVLIAISKGSRRADDARYGTVDSRAMNHEWG